MKLIILYTILMRKPKIKVVDLKTKKPVFTRTLSVTTEEFFDLADAVEGSLPEIKNADIPTATRILNEMRFCARMDYKFRNETFPELEELYYELYERVHS